MEQTLARSRFFWMGVGLAAGLCIAYFWPHEPVHAFATDRTQKFALLSGPAGPPDLEGVFLLDFLTGNLQGHVLNARVGQFTRSYYRNIGPDFQLDAKTEPQWAVVTGSANLAASRGTQWGHCLVYVAELTSGKVIAYGYPYSETQRKMEPQTFEMIDGFQFREAVAP
jgi:hypothetical protein